MNRDWFNEQMLRITSLRGAPASMDGHYEVLAAVDTVELDAAVGHSLRTRTWFPTPAELLDDIRTTRRVIEWRAEYEPVDATEARYEVLQTPFGPLTLKVVKDWKYNCGRCTDSGWASWWCGEDTPQRGDWMESSHCRRPLEHTPHEWVSQCSCWASNPILVRRREALAQAAATRTAKTRGDAA